MFRICYSKQILSSHVGRSYLQRGMVCWYCIVNVDDLPIVLVADRLDTTRERMLFCIASCTRPVFHTFPSILHYKPRGFHTNPIESSWVILAAVRHDFWYCNMNVVCLPIVLVADRLNIYGEHTLFCIPFRIWQVDRTFHSIFLHECHYSDY